METPAGVSQGWRCCGSRLHGNVPTGTELLYFSFSECGETQGKGLDNKRFVFGFFFFSLKNLQLNSEFKKGYVYGKWNTIHICVQNLPLFLFSIPRSSISPAPASGPSQPCHAMYTIDSWYWYTIKLVLISTNSSSTGFLPKSLLTFLPLSSEFSL